MALLDRYESGGAMKRNRKKNKERGVEIGLLGPSICHWRQINHSRDDVLTSGWEDIMGHMSSGH